jgi:hypothetical protein
MIRPVRARFGEYFGRIRNRIGFVRGIRRHGREPDTPCDPALDCRRFFPRTEAACRQQECGSGDRPNGAHRKRAAYKR